MRNKTVSIISPTVSALLTEADELEERVVQLREVAKSLQALGIKKPIPQAPAGPLLSAVPVTVRKTKAAKKKGKRKYTKRSKFWNKK